ncbi:MAG: hypothetical protein KF697_11930, partial [Pseudolabrys sp.]|nr:hypothetical protein [Pseudolabrys sp.]
ADVLVHDDAIGSEILDFARREAQRIPVAPSRVGVAALMNGLAADGKRIVRLISDPRAASRARATRAAATP